jgi:DNA-binding HxlR family transcriptional regulator/predicted RNA-binding Zn-ribbon protein involved in translation (DUF1610 family)
MSAPDPSDSTGRNGLSEASLFESIAHEARIKILYLLQNEPLGFSELKKKLYLTSSGNLQHHINKLGALIESNADGQYTLTDNGREAIMAIQAIRGMQDRPKIIMRGMIFFGTLVFYAVELTVPFLTGTASAWTPVNALVTSIAFGIILYVIWSAAFKVIMDRKAWWREGSEYPIGQPIEQRKRKYRIGAGSKLRCPRCGSEEIGRDMYPGAFGIRARFVYSCRKCGTQWEG